MFMGPLEASLPWSMGGLDGAKRFIERVFRIVSDDSLKSRLSKINDGKLDYIYNVTVKKVTEDFENLQFNTAISQMMIFINEVYKQESIFIEYYENFIKMMSCICPHVCEEIWQMLGHEDIIDFEPWPTYDSSKLVLNEVEIAIQINGKLRDTIKISLNSSEEQIKEKVLSLDSIKSRVEGKEIKKVIIIKNKIVNIVAI